MQSQDHVTVGPRYGPAQHTSTRTRGESPHGHVEYAPPLEVEAVFHEFRTCELSTLSRDGCPQSWPTIPFHDHSDGRFVITTSIGIPQKAYNVRRNGRVSLLFSDPTGSGLSRPPTVLVQADAICPEEVATDVSGFEQELAQTFRRQPRSAVYGSNPLLRYLMDFYYMRLSIYVTPRRILYWPAGDLRQPGREIEVRHVD